MLPWWIPTAYLIVAAIGMIALLTEVRCVAQITTPVTTTDEVCSVPNVGGSAIPSLHRHGSQTSLVYDGITSTTCVN